MTDFPDDAARIVRQAERLARLNALRQCQGIVNRRMYEAIGTPEYATLRPIADEVRGLVEATYADATPRAQMEAA